MSEADGDGSCLPAVCGLVDSGERFCRYDEKGPLVGDSRRDSSTSSNECDERGERFDWEDKVGDGCADCGEPKGEFVTVSSSCESQRVCCRVAVGRRSGTSTPSKARLRELVGRVGSTLAAALPSTLRTTLPEAIAAARACRFDADGAFSPSAGRFPRAVSLRRLDGSSRVHRRCFEGMLELLPGLAEEGVAVEGSDGLVRGTDDEDEATRMISSSKLESLVGVSERAGSCCGGGRRAVHVRQSGQHAAKGSERSLEGRCKSELTP